MGSRAFRAARSTPATEPEPKADGPLGPVSTRDSPQANSTASRLAMGRFSTHALGGVAVWFGALTSLVLTVPATRTTPAPEALADGVLFTRALDWPMVTLVPKGFRSRPRAAAVAMKLSGRVSTVLVSVWAEAGRASTAPVTRAE